MEEDAKEITSPLLTRADVKKQIERLEYVVDEAQKRIDYTVANDQDVIKAIQCVERFLRKKRRVCYGGQAINALLPKGRKFYDEKYNIPDYDFFSPTMEEDVKELIELLEKEQFESISKKLSVHDGTIKVYVNYIPVADCSEMHPEMFKIIQRRAKVESGILYADPDFLRMMMYLELSRPRGQVDRWRKVFERLTLLNKEYPMSGCNDDIRVLPFVKEDRKLLLEYCVKRKLVMAGPEFIELLETNKGNTTIDSISNRGGPLIFFSDRPTIDAEDIRDILQNNRRSKKAIRIEELKAYSNDLFNFVTVSRGKERVALIIEEDACHSYTILKLEGLEMRVGMPDLLLHLYLNMYIFGRKERGFFQNSLECLVKKLYNISEHSRSSPTSFVPAFGLRCSGKQQGIATLLKIRADRTVKARNKVNSKVNSKAKANSKDTRKRR